MEPGKTHRTSIELLEKLRFMEFLGLWGTTKLRKAFIELPQFVEQTSDHGLTDHGAALVLLSPLGFRPRSNDIIIITSVGLLKQ